MWYRTNTGERLINLENGNVIMLNGKQISFNIPHEKTDTFDTEKEAQEAFKKLESILLNDPFRNHPVLACGENRGEDESSKCSSEITNVDSVNENTEEISTTDFTEYLSSRRLSFGLLDEEMKVANYILGVLETEGIVYSQLGRIFSAVKFTFSSAARI